MLRNLANMIALPASLALCAVAWADETLETITVTDSAEEDAITTGEVEHSEFTGVYDSIDSEQLKRRDVALSDLLSFEVGVQSRQVGGMGSFASVSIRASNSNQTAVYLDGIKLNSGSRPSVDLSALELLNVNGVDIYRGSSPIQLGHGSIGGAVNLKSLNTKNRPSTRLLVGGGSFSTRRLQAAHQSRVGPWDFIGAIGNLDSDNDFKFVDRFRTPFNTGDNVKEARNNAAVTQQSALLKAAYRWNSDSDTKLVFQSNDKSLGVPAWENKADNSASFITDDLQFQLSHSINNIGDWNSNLTLFQHSGNSRFDDRDKDVSLVARDSFSKSVTHGGKFYAERVNNNGTLGITAELRNETLSSTDKLLPVENYGAERDFATVSMQYAWFNSSGKLLITPALNLQSVSDQYKGITRRNETGQSNRKLSPQIGALYEVNPRLNLRANLGRYYREPAFYELFGSRGLIRGNENLNSESGINADLGFTYQRTKSWKFDATVFASDRKELITTVYDTIGLGYTINAGHAQVIGLELSHQWRSTGGLSTEVNVTLQETANRSNNPALDKSSLPGEPAVNAFARLAYRQASYRVWTEMEIKRDIFYDEGDRLPAKDTSLQNIGFDWFWENTQTSLAINNVGNTTVQDFNGFPRPGRAFYFTTTINF